MPSDLVGRLREVAPACDSIGIPGTAALLREAADALEAGERECMSGRLLVEKLERQLDYQRKLGQHLREQIPSEAAVGAVREIVRVFGGWPFSTVGREAIDTLLREWPAVGEGREVAG